MENKGRRTTAWATAGLLTLMVLATAPASSITTLTNEPIESLLPATGNATLLVPPGHHPALHIPTGTVAQLTGPLSVGHLEVEGWLGTTGKDIIIDAESIHMGSGARIDASPGARADLVSTSLAVGDRGQDGGAVLVRAQEIVLAPGALIVAGSGGAGGSALGIFHALGGDGGHGGSVLIHASHIEGLADQVHAGAGGGGGHAVSMPLVPANALDGEAIAGVGGNSGLVVINGLLHLAQGVVPFAPDSTLAQWPSRDDQCELIATQWQQSESAPGWKECVPSIDTHEVVDLVEGLLPSCGLSKETDASMSTQATIDCGAVLAALVALVGSIRQDLQDAVDGCLPGLYATSDSQAVVVPGEHSCASAWAIVEQLVNECVQPLSIDATMTFVAPAAPSLDCETILGILEEELGYGLDDDNGEPGKPGTMGFTCTKAQGGPGHNDLSPMAGSGGRGGDACSIAKGNGDVGDGGNGKSRPRSCTNGGAGGPAADVASGNAAGGPGGHGFLNGGDGGDAISGAHADSGGRGGDGGAAWFGDTTCPGGPGGKGGNANSGNAVGGDGGYGLCGIGGKGGDGTSTASAGAGGPGGSGSPAGVFGPNGLGHSGQSLSGKGGLGPDLCHLI